MTAITSRSSFLAEVQALVPDVDLAAVLGEPGRATLSDVRNELTRIGVSQPQIDRLIPPGAVLTRQARST